MTSHQIFVVWLEASPGSSRFENPNFGHERARATWKHRQVWWRGQWLEQWPSGCRTDKESPTSLTKRALGTSLRTARQLPVTPATYLLFSRQHVHYPRNVFLRHSNKNHDVNRLIRTSFEITCFVCAHLQYVFFCMYALTIRIHVTCVQNTKLKAQI